MQHGKLILVIGPTGSGKGTLVNYARALHPTLAHSVSCTTRSARPGEVEGTDYYFLTEEEFQKRIDAGDFLEWACYGGRYYGTLKSEVFPRIEQGISVVLEIEVQGVRNILSLMPKDQILTVYIDAGDWDTLEKRIRARAPMTDEEVARRKDHYECELPFKAEADVVISNKEGEKDQAKKEFARLVESLVHE
jgi:guanylate kinase